MRTYPIVGLCVLASLAAPATALAHATLRGSAPADGAVVAVAPREVRLSFDDTIRAEPGMKAIRNGGGSIIAGSPRVVGGRTLLIPLRPGLPRGDYTVLWRALSDDGHPIAGIVTFAVGAGRAPPHAALAAPSETSPIDILARWLFFAGVLAASGAALFGLALRGTGGTPDSLYVGAFLLVVAGGPALAARASLSTRFGVVVAAATAVAASGALMAATARRHPRRATGARVAALLLLAAPSLSGHALDSGRSPLELPADVLHVAASSIWLGGLLALALQLRAGTPATPLLRAFSTLAIGSVVVLAATGVVRALSELAAISQVWSTSYGRLLLVKTALFGGLLTLGWINRYRLIPALARSVPRLRRNVLAELVLFAGLLTAVALLTQARPGRDSNRAFAAPALPAPRTGGAGSEALVLAQRRGALQVAGRAQSAAAEDAGHVIWETLPSDAGGSATVVRRDLQRRRSTTLARDVAPQYGLAVAGGWAVYATATAPPELVAVRTGGGARQLLSRRLAAPIASRGSRVAWAEQESGRVRIVVRDLAGGRNFLAANLPGCDRAGCYRIDAVTLADRGVVVARGAIGDHPSWVIRRAFGAPRPQFVRIARDPQPDLIPSSAGAAYFALGRGWFRWDFGSAAPAHTPYGIAAPAQPIRYEAGRWYLERRGACGDTILSARAGGSAQTMLSPGVVLGFAGTPRGACATFLALTGTANRPVTTWAVSPEDSHSSEGVTGVITFGTPGG